MSRVLTVVVAVAMAFALTGCAGTPASTVPANHGVAGTRVPSVEPDPETDYIPARIAAARALPEGVSGGDLVMISARPEVPATWWDSHSKPPYKMMYLRLDEGGASPGRFDCWPVVASKGDTWTCDIVVPPVE